MTDTALPETIADVETLENLLSAPSPAAVEALAETGGDVCLLGIGGKMGPTLGRMVVRAAEAAGTPRRVIGVSRFSNPESREALEAHGIETIACDLLDEAKVAELPDCPNVIYLAGLKFGSTGNAALTWAMNTHLPSIVARRFADSRIVAFSSGNVYGLKPVTGGGARETDPTDPVGEYAMSCVGRERIFEHFSRTASTPTATIRLNYAVELRYGVLLDLAEQVHAGQPIDVSMGNMNVIWQADANAMTIAALRDAASPPYVLNVAGPEQLSVRAVAERFGELLEKPVTFTGTEAPDAILSNGQRGHHRYGYPRVPADTVIRWVADWVARGGETLGKPTHFESRDGKF